MKRMQLSVIVHIKKKKKLHMLYEDSEGQLNTRRGG